MHREWVSGIKVAAYAISCRELHLLLAHLVESDPKYTQWYQANRYPYGKPYGLYYDDFPDDYIRHCPQLNNSAVYILDNSAFEMYKQGREMYPSDKLIEMGLAVNANYIVMSDYPGEHSSKTIEAAIDLAPKFRAESFGTFFVPQSRVGDLEDYITSFSWAASSQIGRAHV